MDKQQSDHIENRFWQAADNFLPPQNEEAWKRMEALLDKDPDRRKFFIWWWMFALLLVGGGGIGTYYYLHNRPKEKETAMQVRTERTSPGENYDKGNRPEPVNTGVPKNQVTDGGHDASQQPKEEPVFTTDTRPGHKDLSANRNDALTAKPVAQHRNRVGTYTAARNLFKSKSYVVKRAKKDRPETTDRLETEALQNTKEAVDPAAAAVSASYQQPAYVVKVEIPDSLLKHSNGQPVFQDSLQTAIKDAISKAAKQGPPPGKFYFIVSAGANATNLHKFDTSNVGIVFGGEIGYHLNSTFSIQAGFHAGRKKYFAGPTDYKAKPGSYFNNPAVKIRMVEANCYIFDLPLSLRMDILHSKQRALYATTGLSSFILPKEKYVYHYTSSSGYLRQEIKYEGNVDWFASTYLSIGFEQRMFKTFYLQAEPYAKLPLAGIGEGRIKLYSLGIQLGLKYQPLKKK